MTTLKIPRRWSHKAEHARRPTCRSLECDRTGRVPDEGFDRRIFFAALAFNALAWVGIIAGAMRLARYLRG